MPPRAAHPCPHPGCGTLVHTKDRFCPQHNKAWVRKNTTYKRLTGRAAVDRRRHFLDANPLCVKCDAAGRTTLATEVDHVIPLSQGGRDDESNMQPLCSACHQIKTMFESQQALHGA